MDVIGVAPSNTGPSDIPLVTGVLPSDPGTALWDVATKQGLKAAAVYWPSSMGASVAFDFPPLSGSTNAHDVAFESIASQATPAGTIDAIEKAHPGFQKNLWDDSSSAQAAVWLLANHKADVVFVSLTEVDSIQRETNAVGIYPRDTLENEDELIGQMSAAAGPETVIALVSGHGFENDNYIVRPRVLLKQAHIGGPVEVEDGLIGTEDPKVAARLRQFIQDGRRHGIAREVPMAEVRTLAPQLGNWVAAFDTPPNYVASAEDHGPALGPGTHHGVSGLWPTHPGYRSVFMIAGAGIHPRKLGEIDLLQVAPTLADVVGVKLPQAHKPSLWPSISR